MATIERTINFNKNIITGVDAVASRSRHRTLYMESDGDATLEAVITIPAGMTAIIRQITISPASTDTVMTITYGSTVVWKHKVGSGFKMMDPAVAPDPDSEAISSVTIDIDNVASGESINITYQLVQAG